MPLLHSRHGKIGSWAHDFCAAAWTGKQAGKQAGRSEATRAGMVTAVRREQTLLTLNPQCPLSLCPRGFCPLETDRIPHTHHLLTTAAGGPQE